MDRLTPLVSEGFLNMIGLLHFGNRLDDRLNPVSLTSVRRKNSLAPHMGTSWSGWPQKRLMTAFCSRVNTKK